jgi:prepilin-type N-terminal cleavage/methylation domain-containing protein
MPKRISPIRRGFTMVEITVAVAIIAILASLLVYAISHLSASSKTSATKIMLQNNRGILQEFDGTVGLNRSATFWPWIDVQTGNIFIANADPVTYPTNGGVLWTSSVTYPEPSGVLPTSPLCAPSGSWGTDPVGVINRNGSYAVLYTQLAMRMVGSVSTAKAMVAKIPSGSTMVPIWISGAPYAPGNVVKSSMDNKYYRCITPATGVWKTAMTEMTFLGLPPSPPSPSSSYTTDPSTDSANWLVLGPNETPDPILLDAWGNPILMAPASGLINVWTNCTKSAPALFPPPQWGGATPTTQLQAWVNPLPGGGTPPSYCQKPIVAPDNKPFFYSAGPDGDFTTGDDNIYSFD